ncbi:unnamed protein product [Vicia faba]|uniref:Uncharacterized protein n=1 Tax=Vicia faba TaxID=3906 RepID=A0AAV1AEH4_VICFA|nr:unnamed protein product [Vicia faba]
MVISVFDGEIDAYWWVLCTEKYFKQWLTPETFKMTVVELAMKAENQDGNNAIQTYELITIGQDTVLMVIDKQKDLITAVCKDKDLRFDFDFSFSVSVLGRSSYFTLVTFPLVSFVPSMKEIVNTTSTTSPQNLVTLFDPGRYLNLQES